MNKYGYYRLATVVPQVRVADVEFNTTELINGMNAAVAKGAQLVLFPELCFTSAACADLFHHHTLLDAALNGLQRFCRETSAYLLLFMRVRCSELCRNLCCPTDVNPMNRACSVLLQL